MPWGFIPVVRCSKLLLMLYPTRHSLVPANTKGYMLEEATGNAPDPHARSQISLRDIAQVKCYEKRHMMMKKCSRPALSF